MTISSQTRKAGPFVGNGTVATFPFTFKVFQASDLQLVKLNSTTNVETALVLTTDYTVSLNANQNTNPGGTITLTAGVLPTGYKLTITTNIAPLQSVDLTNSGGFYPSVINAALDKLTILVQQIIERAGRTLTLPLSTPTDVNASLPAPQANHFIGWDQTGKSLKNYDSQSLATVVAYGTAKGDIFTGDGSVTQFNLTNNPGSLNNLDVSVGGVTQLPNVDYSWDGGTLVTFVTAPPVGVSVFVRYMQGLPFGAVDIDDVVGGVGRQEKIDQGFRWPSDNGASPGATDMTAQLTEFARAAARAAYSYTGNITIRVPEDFASVTDALNALKSKELPHDVKFTIAPSGKQTYSAPVVVTDRLENVEIVGTTPASVSIAAINSIAGSAGAYDVTFALSSSAGIEVGDYLIVRGNSTLINNPFAYEHWGCWKVTAVGTGTATVRNTCRKAGLASSATTGGSATIIKTVLRFPNSDGLCIGPEANIGTVNNLVIEGGGSGTSADYGFVVGYRAGQQPVGATSNIRTSGASARIDANFGVSNFDRSGIWVGYGSSLYGEGRFTACGNGEAGLEADSGGFVTTGWYSQQAVFNGNGGNGLLAYNCSGIWAGGFAIACGNGGNGIASLMGSAIVLGPIGCHAAMNVGSGVASEDGSAIDGQNFQTKNNGGSGLRSVRGASFVGTNSVSTGNGLYGAYSAGGANMTVTGATLTGNASHGAYTLNGFLDASNATSTGNGGYGYLSSGGNMRAPSAFGSTSTSGDFAAVNGGVMDAISTKGADASTGARYFADTSGFINAIGSVQAGATYNPPYNTIGNRNSIILAKDIQQKLGISRHIQSFSNGTSSYTPNIDEGQHHNVTFSGVTSFTVANPTNAPNAAHELVIQLRNNNGSTAVTPSFGSNFVTGTVAAISAGGNSSVYTFKTYDGAKYVLTGKIENVVI